MNLYQADRLDQHAAALLNLLRRIGRHPAGILIDPEHSIIDNLPLRVAEEEGQVVTEFPMDQLGFLNLVKFDILTLRTLDTMQEVMDLVAADPQMAGFEFNPNNWRIEYEDPQVWDALSSGDTTGVFQVETAAGTTLTKKLRPHSLADMSAIGTLVRPGPMRSGQTAAYLRRREGNESVTFAHPLLEELLDQNYGLMIYQEDIMRVCQVLAGYTSAEADEVRSILGKKKVEKIPAEGQRFVSRCVNRGVDQSIADALWDQMKEHAKYVAGDTQIWLCASGPSSDGTMRVEDAYRRLHTPLRDPVVGRRKAGEEFTGPCDVCGATASIVWVRGRCNPCMQWRRKFLGPKRGVAGLTVGADGRVHPARLLDVRDGGTRDLYEVTLDTGRTIALGLPPSASDWGIGRTVWTCGSYEMTKSAYDYNLGPGGTRKLREWTAAAPAYCELCGHDGSAHRLERAHLEGDRKNNEPGNLMMLCVSCHKRHDYQWNGRRRRGEKGYPVLLASIVAIEYLGRGQSYEVVVEGGAAWVGDGVCLPTSRERVAAVA